MLNYGDWLIWGIPALMAFLSPLIARVSKKGVGVLSSIGLAISFLIAATMGLDLLNGVISEPTGLEITWINLKIVANGVLKFGVLLDPLSIFMAIVVSFVSTLIFIFSIGYMEEEEDIGRYWFWMNTFVSAMLLLVLSSNLVQLFICWEIVGLCSWALISFWYKSKAPSPVPGFETEGEYNAHCGFKALVTTGFADTFFLVAILMIGWATWKAYGYPIFGFVELSNNLGWIGELSRTALLPIFMIFLLSGPFGKSAQFPYHEWLPEAMAGPTTVSALIHAATMVKAGVYFVARFYPIMLSAESLYPDAKMFFIIVAFVGGFTAFLAGTQGMVARELKKVLAYSTISQIGYMFLILGIGGLIAEHVAAFTAGLFHLSTHAIFKALLFLSAGSVLHSVKTKYLDEMGGLKKYMPITYVAMLVGAFALSGIPPFSGFFSKDEIVHLTWTSGNMILFIFAITTVALTAFYSFRMIGYVFFMEESDHIRSLADSGHPPHESPLVMTVPLMILAAIATIYGFFGPFVLDFMNKGGFWVTEHAGEISGSYVDYIVGSFASLTTLMSIIFLIIGLVPAYYLYIKWVKDPRSIVEGNSLLKGLYKFLWNRWYINTVYYKVFLGGLTGFSKRLRKIQTGVSNVNLGYAAIGIIVAIIFVILLL
ncbi:MAG: NADH-quinone oxidoreductase subunit L [Candidatus Njordarchaeia archaeon]